MKFLQAPLRLRDDGYFQGETKSPYSLQSGSKSMVTFYDDPHTVQ